MKKTLLALLLASMLVLTGCSLVVKDPVVDLQQVILDINGQTVDKQAMLTLYNNLLGQEYQMQQMYQMYGMQAPPIDHDKLMQQAQDLSTRRVIVEQQAKAQGLDALSEEDQQKVKEQADTEWQSALDWVKTNYLADTELTGDELTAELEHRAEDLGILRETTDAAAREQFISDLLEKATTKDVAVPDEDVKADYDAKVEENKKAFADNPDGYGTAVNGGSTVYYAPAGYRYVKQVLIKFLEEDQKVIDEANAAKTTADQALTTAQEALSQNEEALKAEGLGDDEKKALEDKKPELTAAVTEAQQQADKAAADLEAARQAGLSKILPKAQDVVKRAETEDFDALVKELNEDKGMPEKGYAVRKGFGSFDLAFVKPAMELEKVGDVAQPSAGIYGYYVVQYAAEIPEGPVNYDSVKGALHDALLEAKKKESWEAEIAKWTEEADIKTYMERMKD